MFARQVCTKGFNAAARFNALRQVRRLATVTGSAGRQMPQSEREKSTPVSHDRATFTIKVGHSRLALVDQWIFTAQLTCDSAIDPFLLNLSC